MDPIDKLIQHLRKSVTITNDEEIVVRKCFKTKVLKKKEMLLFAGDTSTHMQYIAEGCLRCYYMDEQAKEHIIQFGIEEWWVNDLYSYLTQTPAKQFVQAVENSTIVQIHKDDLDELYDKVPSIERFFRFKFERAYVALQDHTINAMSKTAEERYDEFRFKYRDIEQRVPQYMVASYLGITPEFLSSIRKKID
ncbi:MAG: cyclic nucleotide-binding protein [Flavobacterium sp. MedPE-SWcel]|uniref:Crp/Fnr family transcriptional regulator n=1 Tax=uncultured Flavobacterium sp. TaxID=165435 RepID=UPI00091628D5|nr:Crp/Fnr family transcriptional regulator [uncultured Flavobacterium sp.]OIQ18020.1 MAG: cyclic nucleotide-binding protein [Flavobacterium sp. MedPE-SWcel]